MLCDKMLYFKNELDKNKYSIHQLNETNKNKELFKVDNGLYSDIEFVNDAYIKVWLKLPMIHFESNEKHVC